jgi:hypothetical protein
MEIWDEMWRKYKYPINPTKLIEYYFLKQPIILFAVPKSLLKIQDQSGKSAGAGSAKGLGSGFLRKTNAWKSW